MSKTIYFSNGEKGGVGKTLTAIALAEYIAKLGKPVFAVEADTSNPDFGRKTKHIEGAKTAGINLRDPEGWSDLTNILADAPEDAAIVVNLPAQILPIWHREMGLFADACLAGGGEIAVFWTINRQRDSVTQLIDAMKILDAEPSAQEVFKKWVAVKNLYFGAATKFEIFDSSEIGQTMIDAGNVITLPELPDSFADHFSREATTFSKIATGKGGGFTLYENSAAKRFLTQTAAEFSRVI